MRTTGKLLKRSKTRFTALLIDSYRGQSDYRFNYPGTFRALDCGGTSRLGVLLGEGMPEGRCLIEPEGRDLGEGGTGTLLLGTIPIGPSHALSHAPGIGKRPDILHSSVMLRTLN
jgi:hypothetical protein